MPNITGNYRQKLHQFASQFGQSFDLFRSSTGSWCCRTNPSSPLTPTDGAARCQEAPADNGWPRLVCLQMVSNAICSDHRIRAVIA